MYMLLILLSFQYVIVLKMLCALCLMQIFLRHTLEKFYNESKYYMNPNQTAPGEVWSGFILFAIYM